MNSIAYLLMLFAAPEEALRTEGFIDVEFVHENRKEILEFCVKNDLLEGKYLDNWLYKTETYNSCKSDIMILRRRYYYPPVYMANHFICNPETVLLNVKMIEKQLEEIRVECLLYPFMEYEYRNLKPQLVTRLASLRFLHDVKIHSGFSKRESLYWLKDVIGEDNFWNARLP